MNTRLSFLWNLLAWTVGALLHISAFAQGIPSKMPGDAGPVPLLKGFGENWPVVSIFASGRKTSEPCPTCLVAPGFFTVTRTGPTDAALTVYLESDGTATPGPDYAALPHQVTIPAGKESANLIVLGNDDQEIEGPEIVRVAISLPELATRGYNASAVAREALVVIGDNEAGAPELRLDIVEPKDGTQYAEGTTIEAAAFGVWTQGEVDRPVEFYDGTALIGHSDPPAVDRPTIPCLPSVHRVFWTNPPTGRHQLTARFEAATGQVVHSVPVNIVVGEEPPPTRVRIETTQPIAEESSFPLRRLPLRGEFVISRSGPTEDPLSVFVLYSGTATPGTDCPDLPWLVTIPVGETSAKIAVEAVPDKETEGVETLTATLSVCPPVTNPLLGMPCFSAPIDPAHQQATVFLRDDSLTQRSLTLLTPTNGSVFEFASMVPIQAVAIDLEGYIDRVEFWDGDRKVGESEIVFVRAPDPGTPIIHSFAGYIAGVGHHELTARALGPDGAELRSSPVHFAVWRPERVILGIEATDPLAAEAGAGGDPDPAVFTIRRVAGSRNVDVRVSYLTEGTAGNGADYEMLTGKILLPAGEESVRLVVNPVRDRFVEGDKTVVIRLTPPVCVDIYPPPPGCYLIEPPGAAWAILRDGGQGEPPVVKITQPVAGTPFPPTAEIEIEAQTHDPDGYVRRMEFFADDRKIGEVNGEYFRVPDPGLQQTFRFVWRDFSFGPHRIIARATDDQGRLDLSAPVEIQVVVSTGVPVVTVNALKAFAVEPGSEGGPNLATFRIRRHGSPDGALAVAYSLHGTAENGTDFQALPGRVTIPPGSQSVTLLLVPLADNLEEGMESVLLRLEPPPVTAQGVASYELGRSRTAAVLISDHPWRPQAGSANCQVLPGGLLHFCFPIDPGGNYRIESSGDLWNWETLFDATLDEDTWHFIDGDTEDRAHRFYRLSSEPVKTPYE